MSPCPEDAVAALISEIGSDLENDNIVFPTCLALNFKIRQMLEDEKKSVKDLVALISTDPLITAKLLSMANLRHYNLSGKKIESLDRAITIVGNANVRIIAHVTAMQQFTRDTRSPQLKRVASELWLASTNAGCWAHALAAESRFVPPEKAMYATIMLATGVYLLINYLDKYRAIADNPDCLRMLVLRMGSSITAKALMMLKYTGVNELTFEDYDVHALCPVKTMEKVIVTGQLFNAYPYPFIEDLLTLKRNQIELDLSVDHRAYLQALKDKTQPMQEALFKTIFQY